ncbi:MAG: hypothetical protein JSR34_00135 [Proteobacteria bacterium]|nr:hypothetical protein [Pseudomonadota bacterium]
MRAAIKAGVLDVTQRFGLHAMKHRGITDTAGTRADKQLAGGHKSEAMVAVYDHSLPTVPPKRGRIVRSFTEQFTEVAIFSPNAQSK